MGRMPQPLLDRDARFVPPPPKITDVALIRAARSADVDAMRVLIEGGADPSLRDDKRGGITPLVAVLTGPELPSLIEAERRPLEEDAIAAVDFLLDRGADPPWATTPAPRLCTSPRCATIPASSSAWPSEVWTSTSRIAKASRRSTTRSAACREESGPSLPADNAAAAALRELGARGKEEQRTAAR